MQLTICHFDEWTSADGVVYILSETELSSIFPICRVIAECIVSWTLTPTGGHLVGHNGEQIAIVFRGFPSLQFIHKSELERLRIHRKRRLRTKAVKSLMQLGELTETTPIDTSLRKDETLCAASARVLNSEEQSGHEKGGHVRKVGNCVPCAVGCGRMRSHFRLD